jgi:hypothetical protein
MTNFAIDKYEELMKATVDHFEHLKDHYMEWWHKAEEDADRRKELLRRLYESGILDPGKSMHDPGECEDCDLVREVEKELELDAQRQADEYLESEDAHIEVTT